jgi:hypothetical protein|tara:strand:- start:89 stop:331 length:243 start_codon:yes stop_codon:yes gene_type:complete
MPVVSVSLSEVGWEGYKALPRGKRSQMIDKMLREYALDHQRTVMGQEALSVKEVLERQKYLETTNQTLNEEIKRLKELKE